MRYVLESSIRDDHRGVVTYHPNLQHAHYVKDLILEDEHASLMAIAIWEEDGETRELVWRQS